MELPETMPDKKEMEGFALSFFRSRDPKALLLMSGCELVGVNEAYRERFRSSDTLVVPKSLRAYEAVLNKALSTRPLGSAPFEALEGRKCVCDELDAMDALLREHCVFEYLADKGAGFGSDWHSGLEFVKLRRFQENRARRYQVYRVHARLVLNNGTRLLEARLLPLEGVQAHVTSSAAENIPPPSMDVSVWVNGVKWLDLPQCRPGDTRYAGEYERFDRQLAKALARCPADVDAAKAHLRAFVEFEGASYPQAVLVSNLLRETDGAILEEKLIQQRQRLWDAPAMVEFAWARLEERLAERDDIAKLAAQLPFSLRRNLLRGTSPIQDLEAEDVYTGMIRVLPHNSLA